MAPLCTAKIEEDCSARAMLWTPTMNIHQPTLHLFDQLSVCVWACVCMCVGSWILFPNRLFFMESVITGLYLFFSRSELSFLFVEELLAHMLLQWSTPTLPVVYIPPLLRPTTPRSKVMLSSKPFVIFIAPLLSKCILPRLWCHFMCCWKGQICGMFCLLCWFRSCTY